MPYPTNTYPSVDLTGQTFGQWTVLEFVGRLGKDSAQIWKCRCSCGKILDIRKGSLTSGQTTRCFGCAHQARLAKIEDLTGRRFGKWRVLEKRGRRNNARQWLCRCDCGTEHEIAGNALRQKKTRGCLDCSQNHRLRPAHGYYWSTLKHGAKLRSLEFSLDRKETIALLEKQGGKCALTGLPIRFAIGRAAHMKGETTASLDRKDNTKGYVPGNVWWVHKDINRLKNDYPFDTFVQFCTLIADHARRALECPPLPPTLPASSSS